MNTRPTDNPQSTYSQGSIQDFSFGAEVLSGQRPQASCGGGRRGECYSSLSSSVLRQGILIIHVQTLSRLDDFSDAVTYTL